MIEISISLKRSMLTAEKQIVMFPFLLKLNYFSLIERIFMFFKSAHQNKYVIITTLVE